MNIRVLSRLRQVAESACPASRKYGRTKIPHVRREIDETEREREGNALGRGKRQIRFWSTRGVEKTIGEERHRVSE